ncbi:MAG: hypothetical protein ACRD3O_11150 [Terriglobia bacterium]
MLPATQAKALSDQVTAVGQELFDFFDRYVDPTIRAAAERGETSVKLVQVTAVNKYFVGVRKELAQLGYTVSQSPDPSPSAQYLIVRW